MTSTIKINDLDVPERSKRPATVMPSRDPRPRPPWVQEAARLRANGHSLRGVVRILNTKGFRLSDHNSIRYWLEPEFRARKNAISRNRERKR